MKDQKFLFMTKTKYNNLRHECMVLIKAFYNTYTWAFTEEIVNANVVINVVEDHFFVELLNNEKKRFTFEDMCGDLRKDIKRHVYKELVKDTKKSLPWGLLQGIRPTKLVFKIYKELIDEECNEEIRKTGKKNKLIKHTKPIKDRLVDRYFLSEEMAELAITVAINEESFIPKTVEEAFNSFSVYISIPFCPTRCHYCSFPSHSMNKWQTHMEEYLKALKKEWYSIIPELLKHKHISTVYVGGGTPTSFSSDELRELLTMISETLPMDEVKELTVEAGRPDTITEDKLNVLKEFSVNRISINPQTMHQQTLDTIGRKHSVKQLIDAYKLSKDMGFDRVNMDLIVGLPNESLADIKETINQVIKLNPSEVTVHTLAIKRSSIILENIEHYKLPDDKETKEMLELTREELLKDGYEPYYLYRQKNMVGSYENVGYYKSVEPCIYNIEIMEEVRPIIAFGAGGISKVLTEEGKLIRVENVKNVKDYISRIDTMIDRKRKALELYEVDDKT